MKYTVVTCAHLHAAAQWRLVDAELDASAELDATECAEVADAELVGSTNLGNGRGKRIERGRKGRHESIW